MVEVAKKWTGYLHDKLTHKEPAMVESPENDEPAIQQQHNKLDSDTETPPKELILSPRNPVQLDSVKKTTPSLTRRGSPHPAVFSAELQTARKLLNRALQDETNELLKRTTPVVEFIEYYRNKSKAKTRRGKHQRRFSEPVSYIPPKEKGARTQRISTEGLNPTGTPPQQRTLGNMGKSPSLRDIFTLKKGTSNGGFFSKPSQFLAHLKSPNPSVQEIQRLLHNLEGRQWAFIQKFVNKGGAMALFTVISGGSHKKQPTPDDVAACNGCCACIFALLNACEEYDELCEKMAFAVSSFLTIEMPQQGEVDTCVSQISNITTVCANNFGQKFVLQGMLKRNDFSLLVNLLKTDIPQVEGDERAENISIKLAILHLINKLLQTVADQEEKFKHINTFLRLKLYPILVELRNESRDMLHAITEFEELILKEYYFLLPHAKPVTDQESANTVTLRVPIFNTTYATMLVPYDPAHSTIFDVIAYAYKHASYMLQFDEKLYGIFMGEKVVDVRHADVPMRRSETVDFGELDSSTPPSSRTPSPPPPQPCVNFYGSMRISRDHVLSSLRDSNDGESEQEYAEVQESSKSPTNRSDRSKRWSTLQKALPEKVVKNPLYGKTNPILQLARNRHSIYTKRVLTLPACENVEDVEGELVTSSKKGDWLQGTHKISATNREGWELRVRPWDLIIIWKKRQLMLSVAPDSTTFSDVVEKILQNMKKQDEDRIFEYCLTVNKDEGADEVVWLEPLKYVCTLPPRVRELELRTKPINLYVRSKDSTTHAVLVNDTTTVQQVINEFGNKLGIQGRHLQDYGLYDKITGQWLESGDVLPILQREKIDLHFLLRPRSICVIYQVADCDLSTLEKRKEKIAAAGGYYSMALYESPSQSNFLIPPVMPPRMGLPMEPHSFKSEDVLVHFTLCVSQVQTTICKELGIDPEGYAMYKETPDDKVVELTPWKSLRNQGVTPNSHVLLLRVSEKDKEKGSDANVWDEPPTESNLLYEDQEKKFVAAGTLNQLVRILTSESEHNVFFLETFILTYKSFTDSKTLLRKLGERYTVPAYVDETTAKTIRAHVGIVLKYWITHEDPSEKEGILDEISKFVDSFAEDFSDLASRLEKSIQIERDRLNSPKGNEVVALPDENTKLPPELFHINLLDLDEYTIACQLALQDSERFGKLKITEFFNQAWLRNKAPNVLAMVAHFNATSSAVSTSIVTERLIKKRVKIIEKHITIANWLRKLNDFFSLQAFICGINSSAVNRLKFTFERISSQHAQTLAELEKLMGIENSYKNYRQALKEAKPPCVPHIGVYMTDLTFIDEGNSDNYGNLINFSKRTLVSKTLIEIESHRESKYQVNGVKKIEQFITHLPRLPENELYWASLECEPRGATKSSLK